MKLKDLENQTLANKKVKTPTGVVGYWKSQWDKGVWLSDGESSQVYPQFVDTLEDCLDWELTDEEVNCHKKTDVEFIDLTKKLN